MPILKGFSHFIHQSTERTVTEPLLRKTDNPFERARIKMLFDFIFFYVILLTAIIFTCLYTRDLTNLFISIAHLATFGGCYLMMSRGISVQATGTIAALATLLFPALASFCNGLDISPLYAIPWLMSCLLGYFVVNVRTAIALGVLLCLYLCAVSYLKIHHIQVFLATGYSAPDQYAITPLIVAAYLGLCLRVWGFHSRNIERLEQEMALEKQQQFSALINQNLTKQFLLVKGLSRTGKNEYLEGNTEFLDACFSEIEKQCDTAIHYLDGASHTDV